MEVEKIRELVKLKHGTQKRKQGTPYYLHPFAVAQILEDAGYGIEYQIVGLFHDLLEDTDTTYEELKQISNIEIAEATRLLTKEKGYQMENYIKRIQENKLARPVKVADRIHNMEEAIYADKAFQKRYLKETKCYFISLAKGTNLEGKLENAIQLIENHLRQENLS